ncbi:SNF2 family protein, partial [Ostertagia ostertagi]
MATGIRADWFERWRKWQDDSTSIVYDAPAGLHAQLRPYQQKGYEWMLLLAETGAGACLADDMGLGKTLQTIAFLLRQYEMVPNSRFLIACPASLIYNWQQEFEKFAPALKSFIYNGPNRNAEAFHGSGASVLICSYGTLRADIEQLKIITWQAAIMDESHNIKNVSSLTTRAASQLTAHCRVALSGTPVMNNTFDLYAQLNYLLPGLFGGQEFFRKEICIIIRIVIQREFSGLAIRHIIIPDIPALHFSPVHCLCQAVAVTGFNRIGIIRLGIKIVTTKYRFLRADRIDGNGLRHHRAGCKYAAIGIDIKAVSMPGHTGYIAGLLFAGLPAIVGINGILPGVVQRLAGHTYITTVFTGNNDRARTVKRFLMNYGFPEKNITVCIGKGKVIRGATSTDDGFARDRRVDIVMNAPAPVAEPLQLGSLPQPVAAPPPPVKMAKPTQTAKESAGTVAIKNEINHLKKDEVM